jgi:hypothetical protein
MPPSEPHILPIGDFIPHLQTRIQHGADDRASTASADGEKASVSYTMCASSIGHTWVTRGGNYTSDESDQYAQSTDGRRRLS